ncbi:hypothetical protein [Paenacidovorax monticola]|uniref:hypothetical protein n=1 Tax=Paenacidovorax monticola TaxID=1926868 RepID=UPI001CA63446|nr:hypothetical protein [Paenacidovorax monticola]
MEPIETAAQSPTALRSANELAALPAQTPASDRAQAAAAWKALNPDAKEGAQDQERVRELEAQVTAMKAQVTKERAGVTDLRQRLESIEADRYPSTVVYVLALALALAAGVLAWMWSRMQRDHAKAEQAWRDSVALTSALDKEAHEHALVPHPLDSWADEDSTLPPDEPLPPAPVSAPVPKPAPRAVLADVAPGAERRGPATVPAPAPLPPQPATQATPVRSVHIVNPEELFDILQQAEFFISVGEHDQAIGVLRKHIADRGETSPSPTWNCCACTTSSAAPTTTSNCARSSCAISTPTCPRFRAFASRARGWTTTPMRSPRSRRNGLPLPSWRCWRATCSTCLGRRPACPPSTWPHTTTCCCCWPSRRPRRPAPAALRRRASAPRRWACPQHPCCRPWSPWRTGARCRASAPRH